jgi:hypothetical protein
MVRKISVFTIVLLTIALVINVGDARATPVDIVNAGFEEATFKPTKNWGDVAPTGWTQIGDGDGYVGGWDVTTYSFSPVVAPQGQNVAYTETPHSGTSWVGLEQILDTPFAAGRDYTLTVEVGNSWNYYFSGYRIELLAGDTVIAQDINTLHPDWRKWDTSTVEYIYDPLNFNDSLVGDHLGIRLINLGLNPENGTDSWVGVEFDDVRLENDTIPTPEPATMLLLGAGLIGLAGFGRKKLFRK